MKHNGTTIIQGDKANGSLDVNIQDPYSDLVELFFHDVLATTTFSVNASLDDEIINVSSSTGMIAGQAITIYEDRCFYQSLITLVDGNSISLASPLDCDFSTSATIECGDWNLAKDGATENILSYVKPPSGLKFDIYQVQVHITDGSPMDSGKFGGIAELAKGILYRRVDGTTKNMALVVNNSGFQEFGFTVQYDDKAPTGSYGMTAVKNEKIVQGVTIRLDGTTNDQMQLWIRDNLTELSLLSCTIMGHVVEE